MEEEYFLVHPDTHGMTAAGDRVVARASGLLGDQVAGEFSQGQVEGRTAPCSTMDELRTDLRRVRAGLAAAARAEGLRLCASGTPVLDGPAGRAELGDHPRYRDGARQYRSMLDDFAICAAHTHVHLPDRETAVLVGNHLRPWLPLFIAMSANSPYHRGQDTGYASWRSVIRGRFPCLGPPPYARSLAEWEELASAIAATEAMLEPGMPFWDVRPNPRLPTVEIRTMDVPADLDDTVALTALIRALVLTAADRVADGDPGPRPPVELLRAAYWRAGRDGWSGSGVDAVTGEVLPSGVQARRLLALVRPALRAQGDEDEAMAFLSRLDRRGTGADRQRARMAADPHLGRLVESLVAETCAGEPGAR
ncbi:YbdK family carboxylate-amine ligase [Streptomyces sp. LP05-1]|uniref:Putative glutamate--cysteine ligase 2 n=1 Tax=Streptomyces pyxinae TaxID=2970734 RepID=A0ABT2CKV7_9ACTN|nr:YbdK family carboxylate-amine ligase [Streptomyces sp. LP05-1]